MGAKKDVSLANVPSRSSPSTRTERNRRTEASQGIHQNGTSNELQWKSRFWTDKHTWWEWVWAWVALWCPQPYCAWTSCWHRETGLVLQLTWDTAWPREDGLKSEGNIWSSSRLAKSKLFAGINLTLTFWLATCWGLRKMLPDAAWKFLKCIMFKALHPLLTQHFWQNSSKLIFFTRYCSFCSLPEVLLSIFTLVSVVHLRNARTVDTPQAKQTHPDFEGSKNPLTKNTSLLYQILPEDNVTWQNTTNANKPSDHKESTAKPLFPAVNYSRKVFPSCTKDKSCTEKLSVPEPSASCLLLLTQSPPVSWERNLPYLTHICLVQPGRAEVLWPNPAPHLQGPCTSTPGPP